ncbi:MAG: carbohydrate-binding family 9-like protein [Saprospiraceae bacterium]|nr:carbohydrate-binding family 9-like protein [Saprospiraceae bacterium]
MHRGNYFMIPLLFFVWNFAQGQERKLSLGEQPIFRASRTTMPINIDGRDDEQAWKNTESRSFDYYYGVEKDSDRQRTGFRMLWDDDNIYLFFKCDDRFLTAYETSRDGKPYLDDCAEIFLIPVPDSIETHFGIELNLYQASNDFIFLENIYQGKSGSFYSYDPEYAVGITTDGTINDHSDIDKGWTMEFSIPLKLFRGMDKFSPVRAGNRWAFMAIRQERNDWEPERRLCSTIFPVYGIENVHHANRFGLVEFIN